MTPLEQAAHAGERVILRRLGRVVQEETAPIRRLGRKYAYVVIYSQEVAFDLETGYEKTDYSPHWRILTTEQAADEETRTGVTARLHAAGIKAFDRRIPTAKLRRIADILEEASDDAD